MEEEKLVLTWDESSLTIQRLHPIIGLVATLNARNCDPIAIVLPPNVTLDDIRSAWKQQKSWDVLETKKVRGRYTAMRVIWLPNERCLQWHHLTICDKSYDTFNCTRLTKAIWESGK